MPLIVPRIYSRYFRTLSKRLPPLSASLPCTAVCRLSVFILSFPLSPPDALRSRPACTTTALQGTTALKLTPGLPVSSTLPQTTGRRDRRLASPLRRAPIRFRTPPRRPPASRPHWPWRLTPRRRTPRTRDPQRWAVAPVTVPVIPASCRPPAVTRRLRSAITTLSSSWGSTAPCFSHPTATTTRRR